MIRVPRPLLFLLVLPWTVACWLDVPNLESTEGGYAPGVAPQSESARDQEVEVEEHGGREPAPSPAGSREAAH